MVMIISAHQIYVVGDGVFRARPEPLQDPAMNGEGRVVDVRVVDGGTATAKKVPRNIRKGGLGIARRRELNPFVASIQFQRPVGVSGQQHYAGIVGDRRSENLRKEGREGEPGGGPRGARD